MTLTVDLRLGDCLTMLADLPHVDAVITDPPYGCDNDCDYTRFSGSLSPNRNHLDGIPGDDEPFDPSPWLNFPAVILWGYQFFAQRVPLGTVLVWNKKRDSQLGTFLSDCELAWQKGGAGAYLYRHTWHGFDRGSERGKSLHPSQKPVALMRWCIERVTKPGDTVFDPYMGSGPVGIACVQLGRSYIGIEKVPAYYAIAERRIRDAQAQPLLFDAPRLRDTQPALAGLA